MSVAIDPIGNLSGRLEGSAEGAKTLLIGSHIDTIANAGQFDGCLGIVLALEALAESARLGVSLPFAVEVVAFGNGTGGRFAPMFAGAQAMAGRVGSEVLDRTDHQGTTLAQALQAFGVTSANFHAVERRSHDMLGFIEIHAEQGTVLESEGCGIGIVSAISGGTRFRVFVKGRSGHAGSQSMTQRRDALAAAAEMILAIERIGRDAPALLATVGRIEARPGAPHSIPSEVDFSLDVRSSVNRARQRGCQDIDRELRSIARRRQLTVQMVEIDSENAVPCDQRFTRLFTSVAEELGLTTMGLPSGSRHEGLAIVDLCPVGMLLLRSEGGIAHHPDERVRADDIEAATRMLMRVLETLAPNGRTLV